MDKDLDRVKEDLKGLLHSQPLAVLATQGVGQPYASLVAFAVREDLTSLYFATARSTRKYANLSADSRVALLVDNRSNEISDFRRAMAATATGRATEVDHGERATAMGLYLTKHPHLTDFVHSPTCAFCKIRVQSYVIVTQFQKVVEIPINP